jgi:hypothetical protein
MRTAFPILANGIVELVVPVTTYRFTIEGEITAETAADAYQAVSELLTRIAEARRPDALLRFDLADNLRITMEPLNNSLA